MNIEPSKQIPVPLPRIAAFERYGFGLFLHYGLYSLLGQGEWAKHHLKVSQEDYQKLPARFDAADFEPAKIAELARKAGMKYVCLTTRHHDGFSLYDTRGLNTWDAPHSAAGRDLVGEYASAMREAGLAVFFYHTTLDWWHPDFDAPGRWGNYLDYLNRSVEILCTHYGRIDGFWFDGNWARKDRDWQEDKLYAVIRKRHPEAIIVNNSSTAARGKIGHPDVDVLTFEQGRPTAIQRAGTTKYLAAEMCETINSHWGIADYDLSQKSPSDIIDRLASCRRFGANLLLNIGPTAAGAVPDYDKALLEIVGRWIEKCASFLYKAVPTSLKARGQDFVVQDGDDPSTYYYFLHNLAISGNQHLHSGEAGEGLKTVQGALAPVRSVQWTDNGESLVFSQDAVLGALTFNATNYPYGRQLVVRVAKIETSGAARP